MITTLERREAERKIKGLESEIRARKAELTQLQHSVPPLPVENYSLLGSDGATVSLSDLFGEKRDLILIHNMGKGCPYCTLWADGLNGIRHHLENRAAFVVSSPDRPEIQAQFAGDRGWGFRMVSIAGSAFAKDMGFTGDASGDETEYAPGVSTFRRTDEGKILRVAQAPFGPGDDFCSLWPLLDLLDRGADGWEPKYRY